MEQQDKDLVLKDLCARLLCGVMVQIQASNCYDDIDILNCQDLESFITNNPRNYDAQDIVYSIKPYLRPMSSMTEEEKEEYHKTFKAEVHSRGWVYVESIKSFDWLNAHHFDYRGLIGKGLALEAPEGMYGEENKL